MSKLIEGLVQFMAGLDYEGLHYDEGEAREMLEPVEQLEEKYNYLIGEMVGMETPSNYYSTYALFADSLRKDVRNDIDETLPSTQKPI